jgi:hypothetical protein
VGPPDDAPASAAEYTDKEFVKGTLEGRVLQSVN